MITYFRRQDELLLHAECEVQDNPGTTLKQGVTKCDCNEESFSVMLIDNDTQNTLAIFVLCSVCSENN